MHYLVHFIEKTRKSYMSLRHFVALSTIRNWCPLYQPHMGDLPLFFFCIVYHLLWIDFKELCHHLFPLPRFFCLSFISFSSSPNSPGLGSVWPFQDSTRHGEFLVANLAIVALILWFLLCFSWIHLLVLLFCMVLFFTSLAKLWFSKSLCRLAILGFLTPQWVLLVVPVYPLYPCFQLVCFSV